ncbi:hypothetical protein JYU34_009184 [Plutella xylostella]|uniref:Uncharacterized protein n=1 Tax=Plutella xylostella TaxID=51655 RepID=A0ABQ7QNB7_PLUXY|nr:hypothetical protein JYU34_009184 [Plutella xylostella]
MVDTTAPLKRQGKVKELPARHREATPPARRVSDDVDRWVTAKAVPVPLLPLYTNFLNIEETCGSLGTS